MTKDEMKDKMKDKISMAIKDTALQLSMDLKDAVLQQSFEIICKENEELREQIEKMKCCENCRHYSHTYGHCYSYDSYQNCKDLSNWSLADC